MAGILKIGSEAKGRTKEEEIFYQFQILRKEQQGIVRKIADFEVEENELKVVISTLEKVDPTRKCYRLIGGVLCEKTVKDVLPVLVEKKGEIGKSLIKLREDLTKKGNELNEFKEKHNIRIQGQDESNSSPAGDTDSNTNTTTTGVLSADP